MPADPAARGRLEPLLKQEWAPEALALGARVAYLWCPDGVIASRCRRPSGALWATSVTSRNWTTMTKLQALAAEGQG